jgi:Rps23 Pro-64 3,4-dihydroxylase Tpa1-like proline 4-hydroxylase
VEQYLDEGFSIRFIKPFFIPGIARLYRECVKYFNAVRLPRFELNYSLKECVPFAPVCDGHNTFILQLDGTQEVIIMANPEEKPDLENVVIFRGEEVESNVLKKITLEPGDIFYVPQNLVIFTHTEDKNSLDLTIGIPVQPNWENFLESAITSARKKLNLNSDRVFIPSTFRDDLIAAKELSKKALLSGVDFCEEAFSEYQNSKKFHALHFEVNSVIDNCNLLHLLEQNNGLVKISNFLPESVAQRISEALQDIRETTWNATESEQDYEHNNIAHSFVSAKDFPHSEYIFNIFRRLLPEKESTFSAARYTTGHFIETHDDKAYKNIDNHQFERDIAIIYYLTPSWTQEDGGILIDHQTGTNYVPEYNSLISFIVPRNHEVTIMKSQKSRYSIFGWFLKEVVEVEEPDDEE